MAWEGKDWVALYVAVVLRSEFVWTIGKELYDWRLLKRERSRLDFHMEIMRVKNRSYGVLYHLLPLHVSNIGCEPVIVMSVVARCPGSEAHPRVFAEPGATYGERERLLLKRLEPSETMELPLFTTAMFRNPISEVLVSDADNSVALEHSWCSETSSRS